MLATIALVLLATAAGLLSLAFWWIRRSNLAIQPAGRSRPHLRSLPHCELGQQLALAVATGESSAQGAPAAGGTGAPPQRRKTPSGPSRRAFLRNMMGASWLVTLGGFGGASLAFLWPDLRGGFGAQLTLPETEDQILERIQSLQEPYEYAPGRAYIVAYDAEQDADGQYAEVTENARLMALYWRCVHLGCKVPWCQTSQWLECPCHGSRYNRWGEWQNGPAPRGLDRFPLRVENGDVIVDTGEIVTGPSRQTPSLDQPPEGPSCV